MPIRGIRGAIDVRRNTRGEIHARTQELLQAMVAANRVQVDTIAAAFFTMPRARIISRGNRSPPILK